MTATPHLLRRRQSAAQPQLQTQQEEGLQVPPKPPPTHSALSHATGSSYYTTPSPPVHSSAAPHTQTHPVLAPPDVYARIDQLGKQLQSLEHSVASDVRLILTILQQQQRSSESSGSSMMPDYRESSSDYGQRSGRSSRERGAPHVQRSYSISQDSPSNFRPPTLEDQPSSQLPTDSHRSSSSDRPAPQPQLSSVPHTVTPELPTRRLHQQPPLPRVPQRSQSQPTDLTQVCSFL